MLVTREHMHQMQWLSAIEELRADGLDNIPVPEAFPLEEEFDEFPRTFLVASDGTHSTEGRGRRVRRRMVAATSRRR